MSDPVESDIVVPGTTPEFDVDEETVVEVPEVEKPIELAEIPSLPKEEEDNVAVKFSLDAVLKPVDKLSTKVADMIRGKTNALVFQCDVCQAEVKIYQHKDGFVPARICIHYQFLGLERGKN